MQPLWYGSSPRVLLVLKTQSNSGQHAKPWIESSDFMRYIFITWNLPIRVSLQLNMELIQLLEPDADKALKPS